MARQAKPSDTLTSSTLSVSRLLSELQAQETAALWLPSRVPGQLLPIVGYVSLQDHVIPMLALVRLIVDTRVAMKFGKYLQKRQLDFPEYASSFVNYKALKKLIKQLSATPPILAQNAYQLSDDTTDAQASLQANRATFFFRLERELDKVNAFYLQKEAELKLRLKTLLDKKRLIKGRSNGSSKLSTSFVTLQEGYQQFCVDLNKLQQFIDVNNTAFSKILKKWDKSSKSRTKELYLSRAVEVQPCFNRDVISDLSDQATTSLQEIEAWAEGENLRFDTVRPDQPAPQPTSESDDVEAQILQAAATGGTALLQDWINRLQTLPDARNRFTRIFLLAINDAPEESLQVLVTSGLVDIHAEDEITERNCLHEAAISGRLSILDLGLRNNIDVSIADVYGRIPLHYACMLGRVEMIQALCARNAATVDVLDHDNFTPLIHAIAHHHLHCAEEILNSGARVDPVSDADHVALNLACQYGSTTIAELLLRKGAQLLPDAEGLYPQHLVARSGETPETLLLLEQYGANLDQEDKLYQWTPMFHAAAEGRIECLRLLLQKGADTSILDEKGYSAMYYATWEGHLECMRLLGRDESARKDNSLLMNPEVPGSTKGESPAPPVVGADGIPDLSLPPPIIPLRRYGHNFLDKKSLVQISFQATEPDSILFYRGIRYPAARLTISSKSSDVVPRNIILPIQEDNRNISFQVDNLQSFSVDFDLYPTFGSKIIARSVALPNVFNLSSHSSGRCCLPMFDPRLRAIGQITCDFQVISPFQDMALDIANFATYWRATDNGDTHPNGFITGSSLSGDYIQLFVQQTVDGVSIVYPKWYMYSKDIPISVNRLTYQQCLSLVANKPSNDRSSLETLMTVSDNNLAEIQKNFATSLWTLEQALRDLDHNLNINIVLIYPTPAQEHEFGIGPSPNINRFVDNILSDVFDHARALKESTTDFTRSIVFSSYNVDICTAINWKQPNYPVLLCNDLAARPLIDSPAHHSNRRNLESDGQTSTSVKEAVRVAQSNNFMGLVCTSQLLKLVPSLIESIKVAGLVLVMDASLDPSMGDAAARNYRMPEGIDGILKGNGVLKFSDAVDV